MRTVGGVVSAASSKAGPQLAPRPLGGAPTQLSQLPEATPGSPTAKPPQLGDGSQRPRLSWQGVMSMPDSLSIQSTPRCSSEK